MTEFPFEILLARAWPADLWHDVSVLVAVSGGADSVGLLRGLARLKRPGGGRLWVAHFNHGLRGAESDEDERFVADLATQLDLGFHSGRTAGKLTAPGRDGLEAAAREARYRFLQQTAEKVGARYLVTGHTADDQVETILHRILRGTGLAGLSGMNRVRALNPAVTLVRPLLGLRRMDVRHYLKAIDQSWREDASNTCLDATRNWIRHELLPSIEEHVNIAGSEAIFRPGGLANEARHWIDSMADQLAEKALISQGTEELAYDCRAFEGENRYLVRETLRLIWRRQGLPEQAMGFAEWEVLAELAMESRGKAEKRCDLPGAIRVRKTGTQLVISRL